MIYESGIPMNQLNQPIFLGTTSQTDQNLGFPKIFMWIQRTREFGKHPISHMNK